MSDFLEEYATYCKTHGRPDRVELMLCDANAVLRGKWLPGDDEKKLTDGGVRLPLSTYAQHHGGRGRGHRAGYHRRRPPTGASSPLRDR